MKLKKDFFSREIKETEKQIFLEQHKTEVKKNNFISEIKNGLGSDIKENPNRHHIIKKTRFQKFMLTLKVLFTKF